MGMVESLTGIKAIHVELELMGENVCSRWHDDYNIWRTMVAYTCSGTEYTEHTNVDFWELENCGNNDCVIRDQNKTMQCDVGDIFLMKGSGFPEKPEVGLVHKSPEPQFRADGSVIPRLCLKIDGPLELESRNERRRRG